MRAIAPEPRPATSETLATYYGTLLQHFGPQHWWPARTRLEVIVGAILTQNTSWRNVEVAVARLRRAGLLQHRALLNAPLSRLESCIRPAGYYRQKARTLKAFASFFEDQFGGSFHRLFHLPMGECRARLLSIKGFGPETADSVLLYAGKFPIFVVDAYTRRILSRHGLVPPDADYATTQAMVHQHLKPETKVYNEFHALLVETGKTYCRPQQPRCSSCPLRPFLPVAGPVLVAGSLANSPAWALAAEEAE